MNRFIPALSFLLVFVSAVRADAPKPETRSFELTAVAPPQPALKYQLLFDDANDRRAGNAALLYHDAVLLMGPEVKDKTERALAAYDAKNLKQFDELSQGLD